MPQGKTVCLLLMALMVTSSLPQCRCWGGDQAPGGCEASRNPQMVLISLEGAVNPGNVDNYTNLFQGISNPNNCSAVGTFFVQKDSSSATSINDLYKLGHEIGVTTASGKVPNGTDWASSFKEVKKFLEEKTSVPMSSVVGARAPSLHLGADAQYDGMAATSLVYDSSCVTLDYGRADSMLWPYKYDHVDKYTPSCMFGARPSRQHAGMWQFSMPRLRLGLSVKCPTPTACSPYLHNAKDTFDLLHDTFVLHYNVLRTPFVVPLTSDWLAVPYHAEGTRQFLESIRQKSDDTWIISHHQVMEWLAYPVTSNVARDYFKPWKC